MSETANPTGGPGEGGGAHSEQVRVQHVSARVPEKVSRGAFSTGAIVMTGASEFILDFIQNLSTPPSVTARIVMPHVTLPQFIEALRKRDPKMLNAPVEETQTWCSCPAILSDDAANLRCAGYDAGSREHVGARRADPG